MVKKASFLGRLADRFRTGSVRVEDAQFDGDGSEVARVEPLPMAESATRPVRKLSEREEALLALNENFSELTTTLRDLHTGMDSQLSKLVDNSSAMQSLRESNEDQSTRLQRSIESNTAWNKAVMTSFFIVVLGAIAVAVALTLK